MTSADNNKASARVLAKQKIASLSESYITDSDKKIYDALFEHPRMLMAGRVFAYYSVGREVSTHAIIRACFDMGKAVALPVIQIDGIMFFADIAPEDPALISGRYGIQQPPEESSPVLATAGDIILVPALCFDREGFRLGRGGGYYDRYLAETAAFSVGLCRGELLVERLPRQEHDIAVSTVITD